MAIDHDNDSGDGRSKSRWLAPGVLDRARELTEGIRTSVERPSPPPPAAPPKRTPDRREPSEWAPSPPETTREESREAPERADEVEPDVPVWSPPSTRQAPPAYPYPAPARPKRFEPAPPPPTPLSRRLRNLTLRSQAARPLTPFWIAGAVAVVAAAGVAGLLIGRSGGDEESQRVSTAAFSITIPPDWERRPGSADARSLALGAPVAAGPADQTDAGLLAGTLPATAVPASPAIARPLDPTPPRADLVRLGRLPAYRYEGLRRPGTDRVATLYVIPRRSDSLAIACFAPQAASRAFLAGCAATATTLVPSGAAGTARDSLERYLDRAGAVVNRLGASRSKGRRALARAQTSKAQALAAKQLVGGYNRAAARLGRIRGGGPAAAAVRPLIRDLRGTARAYRRLAVAAAKGAPGSYNAARRSIRSGEAAIQRRIATL